MHVCERGGGITCAAGVSMIKFSTATSAVVVAEGAERNDCRQLARSHGVHAEKATSKESLRKRTPSRVIMVLRR